MTELPSLPSPRVGVHPGFTRVVLDLPPGAAATVTSLGGALQVLVTGVKAIPLTTTATRPELSNVTVAAANGGATISLATPQGVTSRSGWRASLLPAAGDSPGSRLVLDLSGAFGDDSPPPSPLVYPFVNSSGLNWKVVLDPGHGGSDPGALGVAREADVNLSIALLVANDLRANGVEVVLTRGSAAAFSADVTTDLASRAALGQGMNAFVSIHANATSNSASSTAYGPEVYAYGPDDGLLPWLPASNLGNAGPALNPTNATFAGRVAAAMGGVLGVKGRGPRTANYYVLRNALCPAILVETGFITHPVEGLELTEPDYQARVAAGIAWGVMQYLDADVAAAG